jgi:hypothetical protein
MPPPAVPTQPGPPRTCQLHTLGLRSGHWAPPAAGSPQVGLRTASAAQSGAGAWCRWRAGASICTRQHRGSVAMHRRVSTHAGPSRQSAAKLAKLGQETSHAAANMRCLNAHGAWPLQKYNTAGWCISVFKPALSIEARAPARRVASPASTATSHMHCMPHPTGQPGRSAGDQPLLHFALHAPPSLLPPSLTLWACRGARFRRPRQTGRPV